MTITDATRFRWDREGLIGHWRDRRGKRLEDYLDEAMAALVTAAVAVKHRLAEEAESERRRAQELERRRQEQARRERAVKRHDFILKKADEFARYEKLVAFAAFLERKVFRFSDEPVDCLIDELKGFVEVMGQEFEREKLLEEIVQRQLYAEDDVRADPADQ